MDTKGGKLRWGGDGGVPNWAIGIDMYTLMCIKLMPNKNLLYKKNKKQETKKTNRKNKIKHKIKFKKENWNRTKVFIINIPTYVSTAVRQEKEYKI